MPSSSTFTNYMLTEVTLNLLHRSSKKPSIDGRYICKKNLDIYDDLNFDKKKKTRSATNFLTKY